MPVRADRPFRPIRRTLTTAITVSLVFAVVGYGEVRNVAETLIGFVAVFVLAVGAGFLIYRKDIAAQIRARRTG
jgi:hypothetical protein